MIISTLATALEQYPSSRGCLLGIEGCETATQLLQTALTLRANMPWAERSRVALSGLAPAELVQSLIALDGIAEKIMLLPPSLDARTEEALLEKASITHVVRPGLKHISRLDSDAGRQPKASTSWLLATSGTTGTPKLVEHRLATLTRTVRIDRERGSDYIWGLLYDPNRFAGLQVILQALLSGSALVLPEKIEFESQMEAMLCEPVNALSATPTLWRKLLMDGRVKKLPLRQLTLGGETADQGILDALKSNFPQARVVHIYASTEAGTGFAVKDGRAGFPSAWLENATHIPLLRVNENHHLLIKPPLLPNGSEIESRLDNDGYLDTEDLVRIENDRVEFLGRASGAINVGGNKVNPESLETFLRGIDGVADARVFAKSSSMMGQLVAAEIVALPDKDTQTIRKQIIHICRNHLEAWQVPAIITFVPKLKETAAGKRERAQL